jgi:NADH-quinone oxidoreductase subunit C
MSTSDQLVVNLQTVFGDTIKSLTVAHGEVTLELDKHTLRRVAMQLRDDPLFHFEQLIDVCGVDYLNYGLAEWSTDNATATGFERGVQQGEERIQVANLDRPRFAAVYHLLSISLNQRLRLKVFLDGEPPMVDSLISVWPSANWFEREAFDLYGILFNGHEDLRRILTDYGFIGHPFRKDFPLIGTVEMRYDASEKRVIYEPVSITPRTLVPKVIRRDNRYVEPVLAGDKHG